MNLGPNQQRIVFQSYTESGMIGIDEVVDVGFRNGVWRISSPACRSWVGYGDTLIGAQMNWIKARLG